MYTEIELANRKFRCNLSKGTDISTTISANGSVLAYFMPPPRFEAFCAGNFIGDVSKGGACNCENIQFNAHGNGTHTECVGHISREKISVNDVLKSFHFNAQLISIKPHRLENGDYIILKEQIEATLTAVDFIPEALIIRTIPNDVEKLHKNYSGTNPTYIQHEAAAFIANNKIKHLLFDQPSVDREEDGGSLLAHHAFWQYPENTRNDCTITELIYVPDELEDGLYLLNLQMASFESDASPSKPVLYKLEEI